MRKTGDFDAVLPTQKRPYLDRFPKASASEILAAVRRGEVTLQDMIGDSSDRKFFNKYCGDKEIVLAAVRKDGGALSAATFKGPDGTLNDDEEVVLAALQTRGMALRFASERLRGNEAIVQAAAGQDPAAVVHATPALLQRMEGLLCRILSSSRSHAQLWHQLPSAIKKHRTVAIAALRADGMLLEHMPGEMQKDEEVVMCAVTQNGDAVRHACRSLRANKSIALIAVRRDGMELKDLSFALRDDTEVVACAVGQNANALQYALKMPRGQVEVVSMAVERSGAMLAHASEDLQCNINIASTAITNYPAVYRDLCRSARHNRDIALITARCNGMMLQSMPSEFQKDREIVLAAVTQNGDAIQYACRSLRGDKSIALVAVARDGLELRDLRSALQDDAEVVQRAVQQNPLALEFASDRLRGDPDIAVPAVNANAYVLRYTTRRVQQDVPLVVRAVRACPAVYNTLCSDAQAKHDVALAACQADGMLLQQIPSHFRKEAEIVLAAVTQTGAAYCYASPELRRQRHIAVAAVQTEGAYVRMLESPFLGDKGIMQLAMRSNPTVICYADAALKKDPDLLSMLSDKQRARYAGTWGIPLPEAYWLTACPKLQWAPDSSTGTCTCGTPFTFFTRRHHCRACGQVRCSDCCFVGVAMVGCVGLQRCCLTCFDASRLRVQTRRSIGIPLTPQIADVSAFHAFLQQKLNVPPAYCGFVDLVSAVDVAVVIDDSGSMRFPTRPDNADAPSRWVEMQTVLSKMFEVWTFLGMKVDVYFMNRRDCKGVASMSNLGGTLSAAPNGGTPTVLTLTRLFREKVNADAPRPLVTYLFTDGEPDGSFEEFERFLMERPCKQHSLFSIILCTDEEPIVAQYRRLENEVVLMPDGIWNSIGINGIDVTEDFFGEQRDVKRLGRVAPLQPGEYLVKCLAGPLNPAVHLIDLPPRPTFWAAPPIEEMGGGEE